MIFQTRAKTTLDTNGHIVLPSVFMNKIGLKEKTEITAGYNGKIIIISFADNVDHDAALKKIDAKNLKMSDLEINKEIEVHRKERRENRHIV